MNLLLLLMKSSLAVAFVSSHAAHSQRFQALSTFAVDISRLLASPFARSTIHLIFLPCHLLTRTESAYGSTCVFSILSLQCHEAFPGSLPQWMPVLWSSQFVELLSIPHHFFLFTYHYYVATVLSYPYSNYAGMLSNLYMPANQHTANIFLAKQSSLGHLI